jgi:hypothetical protein
MSRIRIAKVRTQNFRPPPTVGNSSPVGRRTAATTGGSVGLDYLDAIQRREAAEHDRAVAGMETELQMEIAIDLGRRLVWNRKDPEQRWVMARKAAVLRALGRKGGRL